MADNEVKEKGSALYQEVVPVNNKLLNVVKSIGVGALLIGVSGMSSLLYANTIDGGVVKGYYNVLTDVIKTHGIYKDRGEVSGNGLVYANLQDFEGDGIPELYMIRSRNDENSIGGYVESVWGISQARLILSHQNIII